MKPVLLPLALCAWACGPPPPAEDRPEPTPVPQPAYRAVAPAPSMVRDGFAIVRPDAGAFVGMPVYAQRLSMADYRLALEQVVSSGGFDYVALGVADSGIVEAGWRCARAKDKAKCHAAWETARPTLPRSTDREPAPEPRVAFLLSEHAGVFAVASTGDAVKRALGPVDTLAKAALAAWLEGYDPWSSGPAQVHPTGQADGNAWRLTARSRPLRDSQPVDCAWTQSNLYVARDGTVRTDGSVSQITRLRCEWPDRARMP